MTLLTKPTSVVLLASCLIWATFINISSQDTSFLQSRLEEDRGHYCGTTELSKQLFQSKPEVEILHNKLEKEVYKYMQNNSPGSRTVSNYTLPVVVHIIHNNGSENISDALVFQGIQHLNESFANIGYYDQGTGVDTGIEFCMAERDPDGNATNGITRDVSTLTAITVEAEDIAMKNINRWDPNNYINIWIVREICSVSIGCGVAGYAYLPSSHGENHDGIVIEANWMGSSNSASTVLSHEMGHYLGLYHTFQGGCNNDDCLSDGDRVCDTPPDQSTSAVPCNATPNTCTTDVNPGDPNNPFTVDQNDMFWNYMDYGDWNCYSAFTNGQSLRMEFFTTGTRASLLDSDACLPPCTGPITASFTSSANPVNIGTSINFNNTSAGANSYEWQIDGLPFSNSTNSTYNFSAEGFYVVTLIATNSDPNCFESFSDTIEVVCPVIADFNASATIVEVNELIELTNNSTNATNYEWTLNGVSQGNSTDFSFSLANAAVVQVCMEASDAICGDIHCEYISIVSDDGEGCDLTYIKTIGETGIAEGGTTIITSGDGNFFLTGYREDSILIIKMSPEGEPFWIRSFNFTNDHDRITEIKIDSENNIIGCGNSIISSSMARYFAFKYDFVNDILLWTQQIIQPDNNYGYRAVNIFEPVSGSDYFVVFNSHLKSHLFELNRDTGMPSSNLTKLFEPNNDGDGVQIRASIIHDNSIFIAGQYMDNQFLRQTSFLSRLDLEGNEIWSKRSFLTLSDSTLFYATDIIEDNGALVITLRGDDDQNNAGSPDLMLQKNDMDGNMLWAKKYMTPFPYSKAFKEILAVPDGYILFGSATQTSSTIDFFIMKTDKNGEALWAKKYIGDETQWIPGEFQRLPYLQSELIKFNGSLYFTSRMRKSTDSLFEFFVIRTNLDGNVGEGCDKVIDIPVETLVYTNPVNDNLNLLISDSPRVFEPIYPTSSILTLPDSVYCTFSCLEICDNGIDDNGDGLIDFYDPDCPCTETITCGMPFYNNCPPECESPIQSSPIEMEVLWSNTGVLERSLYAVADVNGDCVPDIITGWRDPDNFSDHIAVLNSITGEILYKVPILFGTNLTNPAVGEVDNDGMAEIFFIQHNWSISPPRLTRFDYDPLNNNISETWLSSTEILTPDDDVYGPYYSPGLSDFDENGIPEVYVGNQIFNVQNGLELVNGGANNQGLLKSGPTDFERTTSIAIDAIPDESCVFCQGLELVAGGQVYTVNLASYTNPSVNSMVVEKEYQLPGNTPTDGATRVVDFDRDGDLDLVVATKDNSIVTVFVWDILTESLIGNPYIALPNASNGYFGPPTVGDIDNDGWPEILITTRNNLNLLDDYQNGGGVNWGNTATTLKETISIDNYVGSSGIAVFDLNNDGSVEIIHRDLNSLGIFDSDLNLIVSRPCSLFTLFEYPVIADFNGDGETGILCGCDTLGLIAFQSANEPWVNSRKIWNQYNYFVSNVNDDGTIPVQQQNHHIVGDSIVMNRFLIQQPILNDENEPFNPISDATLTIDSALCNNNNNESIEIHVNICNTGDYVLFDFTPITIYFGDPTSSVPVIVSTNSLGVVLESGNCINAIYTVPNALNQPIYVIVNDDGSGNFPYDLNTDFPLTSIGECDFENNMDDVEITESFPPPLNLGPDVIVCENGIFDFNAGSGFDYYKWHDGSTDSTFTTWLPGTYWVTAWNDCGALQSDTVEVTIDNASIFDLGLDTVLCGTGSLTFSVPGFDYYEWFPKTDIDCDSCETATINPTASTTYTLVAGTDIGCISVDSIEIIIADTFFEQIDTFVCAGNSVIIDGVSISANDSYLFDYQSTLGCDSTILVNVIALDTFYISMDTIICQGSTIIIDGEILEVNTSTMFSYNSIEGCDSIIVINVLASDTFFTIHNAEVCQGSSYNFDGIDLEPNTSTPFYFTSTEGCDSIVLVNVSVLSNGTYFETIDTSACEGNTLFFDGLNIPPDSSATFEYISFSGCDSTIVINVLVSDTFFIIHNVEVCQGSSYNFDGIDLEPNTSTPFYYTSTEGCDSTVLVNVSVVPNGAYFETIDTSACAGNTLFFDGINIPPDSTAIFEYTSFGGCDSTIVINVLASDTFFTIHNEEVCQGSSYNFDGIDLEPNTSTPFYYTSTAGCDSTVLVNVSTLDTFHTFQIESICEGESIIIFGNEETLAGDYTMTFNAANGCDSTVLVSLGVFDSPELVLTGESTCPDDSTGAVITSVFGGNGPFDYNWNSTPDNIDELQGVPVGTYTVTITDINNWGL